MESSVQGIKKDLEDGEGLYEPIVVAYDPDNGYAMVAEGNHRVEAAIQAGEEFVPVVVMTGNVSTKKSGEATPGLVEKTPGARFEAEPTSEVNPYFIFPDSDILTVRSDDDIDLDQASRVSAKRPRIVGVRKLKEGMTIELPDGSTKTVVSISEDSSRSGYINNDKRSPISIVDTTIEYSDGSKDVWSRSQSGPIEPSSPRAISEIDPKKLFYKVIGQKSKAGSKQESEKVSFSAQDALDMFMSDFQQEQEFEETSPDPITIVSPDGRISIDISSSGKNVILNVEVDNSSIAAASMSADSSSEILEVIEETLAAENLSADNFKNWTAKNLFYTTGAPEDVETKDLSSLTLKDTQYTDQYVDLNLVKDKDDRTLADITGLEQDRAYKLYTTDGVVIYDIDGESFSTRAAAEKFLISSGKSEEELDDILDDSVFYAIEPGTYALPSDADSFEYADRIPRFKLNSSRDDVTLEEIEKIRAYTNQSDRLNAKLRSGDSSGESVAAIDSLIEKEGKRPPRSLYRGINFTPEQWEKLNLKVGSTVVDPAFVSTTKSPSVAERFSLSRVEYSTGATDNSPQVRVVYELDLDPTTKALEMDVRFLPPASESEYLLPRNLAFEVSEIKDQGRFKVVSLKQIPAPAEPDLNQGLPGISKAEAEISADELTRKSNSLFSRLRADLVSIPRSQPEKVAKSELTTKVAADVSTNKNVVASVLQEVKEALKSPRNWVKNFTQQGRTSPLNPVNNHEYKAFNLVALSAAADKAGYSDPRWLTAQEAEKAYGAKLKAGATPTSIAVPTLREYQSEDGSSLESVRFAPVQVYNAEQFDGMPKYEEPETVKYTPAEAFQVILDRFNRAEIERKGRGIPGILGLKVDETSVNPDTGKPLRSPNYSRDRVKLPLREQFKSDEAWIQSLAHELIHSTGAAFRQNRPETQQAGTDPIQRAKEEAIAEMASAMLMKMFGLNYDTKNSAAYIATEASRGKFSDADLVDISTKAQAAIDYMLGNDIDTMPKWDPTQTKRPKTPTEFRNTELTPLASSINPDTSQDSINAMDIPTLSLDQDVRDSSDAKERVYNALIEKLKKLKGQKVPWRKGYKDGFEFTGGSGLPRNPASKHIYSGFNAFWLKIAALSEGYTDSRWMTFKQAKDLGGNVRKGEKSIPILRPIKVPITKKDKDGKPVLDKNGNPSVFSKMYFKAIPVFNVEQIEGLNLPDDKPSTNMAPVDAQEFILERYIKSMEAKGLKPPKIDYSYVGNYSTHDSSPNWSPLSDKITLPSLAQFNSPEEVFDTLMHELTHSTGHPKRLDRSELTKDYGNPNGQARAQEELIAEMGAAILGEMFGVEYDVDNTQAYMQSWFSVLDGQNPEILQLSASKAQQAVDYMLGMDLGDWSPLEGYNNYLGKQGQEGDEE